MKVGGVGEIAMRREMKKNAEKEQGKNIFVVVPKKIQLGLNRKHCNLGDNYTLYNFYYHHFVIYF
jgi:hypothetical protein